MVNWKVRAKNKMFWLAMIPALFMLVQQVLAIFGVDVDIATLQVQLMDVVETVFMILAIMGIVADPTTKGVGDSDQAKEYTQPK